MSTCRTVTNPPARSGGDTGQERRAEACHQLAGLLIDARRIGRAGDEDDKGGHGVPDGKVRERYARSLEQFRWFVGQADRAWVYDNSGPSPRDIGSKRDAMLVIDVSAPDALFKALNFIED